MIRVRRETGKKPQPSLSSEWPAARRGKQLWSCKGPVMTSVRCVERELGLDPKQKAFKQTKLACEPSKTAYINGQNIDIYIYNIHIIPNTTRAYAPPTATFTMVA
jgi:hypothetical protein